MGPTWRFGAAVALATALAGCSSSHDARDGAAADGPATADRAAAGGSGAGAGGGGAAGGAGGATGAGGGAADAAGTGGMPADGGPPPVDAGLRDAPPADAGPAKRCRVVSEVKLADQTRSPDALLWWNDAWIMAAGGATARVARDGSTLTPWTDFTDPAVERGSTPRLAVSGSGPVVAYAAITPTGNGYTIKTVKLDSALRVTRGPTTISTLYSLMAGMPADGTALAWAQGSGSRMEGYRFSLLAEDGTPVGTPDVWNNSVGVRPFAAVGRGQNGYLGVFNLSCVGAQRYDLSGARVGAAVTFPTGICPDHDRTGVAFTGGNYLVTYSRQSSGYLGYTVVAESDGAVVGSRTLRLTMADTGMPNSNLPLDQIVSPVTAAFQGTFGIACSGAYTNTSATIHHYYLFLLVGAAGEPLSAPFSLGEESPVVSWPTPSPILVAGPDGYTAVLSKLGTGKVISTIACD